MAQWEQQDRMNINITANKGKTGNKIDIWYNGKLLNNSNNLLVGTMRARGKIGVQIREWKILRELINV